MRTDFRVSIKESRVVLTLEMREDDSFWDWLLNGSEVSPHSKCLSKHWIPSKKKFWSLERKEWRMPWEIRWGCYKGKVWMQTSGLFLGIASAEGILLNVFKAILLIRRRWVRFNGSGIPSSSSRLCLGRERCIQSIGFCLYSRISTYWTWWFI